MIKIIAVSLLTFCASNLKASTWSDPLNAVNNQTQKFKSPATDSLKLDSLIQKLSFNYDTKNFSGTGWDKLSAEVAKSHFVLVGEDHGFAEIPVFTAHLAQILKPAALVAEIDPYTALELKKVSIEPAKYSSYFKQYPYALSFFSYETEMELARQMQLSHIDIWGLNEINFLSIDRFFITLSEHAKSPANKKLALSKASSYTKHDQPIFQDAKRYSELSAYKLQAATVDSILHEFRNEDDFCKKMLNNLKLSIAIFPNTKPLLRTGLMKKNLLNYLAPNLQQDEPDLPKLLFKFGANHVAKTSDVTNMNEAGNLADNLAEAVNKKTLHILITCKKGTVNQMAPVDNTKAIIAYDIDKSELAGFKQFADKVKDDEWAVFDLRPIRRALKTGKLHTENTVLKNFVLGFDVLVISGKATGSRFIE